MEPEAEEQCDKLISLAISTDPENVEALDSLASVRLSQSRNEEAEQIVHKAWTITSALEPGQRSCPFPSICPSRLTHSFTIVFEPATRNTGIRRPPPSTPPIPPLPRPPFPRTIPIHPSPLNYTTNNGLRRRRNRRVVPPRVVFLPYGAEGEGNW